MTHTAEQFLDAILREPESDTPRLIFADWLDEQVAPACTSCTGPGRILDSGNEWKPHPDCKRCRGTGRAPDGNAARAEFIRVQCELAKPEPHKHAATCPRYALYRTLFPDDTLGENCPKCHRVALRRRERELWAKIYREFDVGVVPGSPMLLYDDECRLIIRGENEVATVQARRGFVAEVTLTAEAFCGGVCRMCDGTGNRHVVRVTKNCPACSGKGRTPGVAGALFKAAPIEKVTLSDKRPAGIAHMPEAVFVVGRRGCNAESFLPAALRPFIKEAGGGRWNGDNWCVPAKEMESVLNAAILAFGRAAAKEGK